MDRSLASRIKAANSALLANGKMDRLAEFFAPDYVGHGTGRDLKGHDGIRKFIATIRRGFPMIQVEVDILVKNKDRIAWQRTLKGIQQAAFMGFPASGRRIVWRDMVTSRFRAGLIVEDWVITDLAERLLRGRKI